MKLEKYAFNAINTNSRYVVHSSNKLLANEPYIVGIKTGYTNEAGACLIARAKSNDKDVLMVMLNVSKENEMDLIRR